MNQRTFDHWVGIGVIVAGVVLYGLSMAAFAIAGTGVGVGGSVDDITWSEVARVLTVYLFYAVVGGLILRHSARNPIGLLVAIMGVVPLLGNLAEVVAQEAAPGGALGNLALWIIGWYFYVFFGAFVPLFHVFPTGKPMQGVWRWWYRVALLGAALMVFMGLFSTIDEGVVNPFEVGFVRALQPVSNVVVPLALLGGLLSGVASLGVRFRRAQARERQQLKWFFFSVVVAVALFGGAVLVGEGLGLIPVGIAESMASLSFPLPAVGIFFAVVRAGLFDIDRIVSRTFSYFVVAVVVLAIYAVPVLVLPEALGLSSDLTVAGATLAAAAMFNPLRRRIQSQVDRRFNRVRYNGERVVERLASSLQSAVELDVVRADLGAALTASLHPSSVSVWFDEQIS